MPRVHPAQPNTSLNENAMQFEKEAPEAKFGDAPNALHREETPSVPIMSLSRFLLRAQQ